jgi:hypothetical protein
MAGGHDAQQTQGATAHAVLGTIQDVLKEYVDSGDAERFLGETVGQSRIPDSRCHRFCGNPLLSAPLTTCAVSHGRHVFFAILKEEEEAQFAISFLQTQKCRRLRTGSGRLPSGTWQGRTRPPWSPSKSEDCR